QAADWFAKYFAAKDVEQLGWDNEAEINSYKKLLLREFSSVPASTRFSIRCKRPKADPTSRMQPRRDSIQPVLAVPIEQFVTDFDPHPNPRHGSFKMLVNYVYVDGAFRYVGRGAYPFWSMP